MHHPRAELCMKRSLYHNPINVASMNDNYIHMNNVVSNSTPLLSSDLNLESDNPRCYYIWKQELFLAI